MLLSGVKRKDGRLTEFEKVGGRVTADCTGFCSVIVYERGIESEERK